jgi:hypothetical protein
MSFNTINTTSFNVLRNNADAGVRTNAGARVSASTAPGAKMGGDKLKLSEASRASGLAPTAPKPAVTVAQRAQIDKGFEAAGERVATNNVSTLDQSMEDTGELFKARDAAKAALDKGDLPGARKALDDFNKGQDLRETDRTMDQVGETIALADVPLESQMKLAQVALDAQKTIDPRKAEGDSVGALAAAQRAQADVNAMLAPKQPNAE